MGEYIYRINEVAAVRTFIILISAYIKVSVLLIVKSLVFNLGDISSILNWLS